MQVSNKVFKPRRAAQWTRERIDQLGKQEIQQLKANALALDEQEIVALCEQALLERPRSAAKRGGAAAGVSKRPKRLISRGKAFEARGVMLQDLRGSWSGVRKSDGTVVMTIWADGIESSGGGCSYLLWAPNVEGSRPWSEKPAGRERLEHCRLVPSGAAAEGLLVYGERLEGFLPEDKARSVHGVDPETVVHFQVEQRGEEYWATWGKKLT